MTREEFKEKWNSDERGGGITYNDVAKHYVEWGLGSTPYAHSLDSVLIKVLRSAGVDDLPEEGE